VGDVKSRAAKAWVAGNAEEEPDRQDCGHSADDEEVEITRGGEIAREGSVFLHAR
jgi:hypothetical protein